MSPKGSVENKSRSLGKVTFSTTLYLKQNLSPSTQQPKSPIIQCMGLNQHGPARGLGSVLPTGHFLYSTACFKRDVWLRAYEQWCSCHCSAQPGRQCLCWWEETELQQHDSKRIPNMASAPCSLSQLWSPELCKNPHLLWSTTQSCKILETALSYLLPSLTLPGP